jgi:hypothetical protein
LAEDVGIEEGDIIFVTRTDGYGRNIVRDLAELRVRAVIAASDALVASDPQMLPLFREAGIPLLSDTQAGVQVRGKQGLAAKGTLESSLRDWQGQQEKHEWEKKSEMIEHIFKEYKSERGKEVRKGG